MCCRRMLFQMEQNQPQSCPAHCSPLALPDSQPSPLALRQSVQRTRADSRPSSTRSGRQDSVSLALKCTSPPCAGNQHSPAKKPPIRKHRGEPRGRRRAMASPAQMDAIAGILRYMSTVWPSYRSPSAWSWVPQRCFEPLLEKPRPPIFDWARAMARRVDIPLQTLPCLSYIYHRHSTIANCLFPPRRSRLPVLGLSLRFSVIYKQ